MGNSNTYSQSDGVDKFIGQRLYWFPIIEILSHNMLGIVTLVICSLASNRFDQLRMVYRPHTDLKN